MVDDELDDGVRTGFGDVVAADGDAVEVAHVMVDEVLLDVAHHVHREFGGEDAGVLVSRNTRVPYSLGTWKMMCHAVITAETEIKV